MTAQPPGSPPPGFTVPPPRFTNTVPIARPPQFGAATERSEVQDSVPQDAPYAPVGAAVAPPSPSRWSGKRTAAIAALALALTTAGALAAAQASPNGIQAPTEQRSGPGFGPGGGGPNRQFRPGGGAPGQQGQQGQQGGPRQRFQQQPPANPQQNGSDGSSGQTVTT
ncbi:MAG TPA: hypothetical protein VFT68_08660 [Lapillicoccus sp.]|nr:hypothetical protein [Lapillicoccus sp.]